MFLRSSVIGACIGGAIAYALYQSVPAYQAFIDWQFAHPLMWLGLPVGVAIALFTD